MNIFTTHILFISLFCYTLPSLAQNSYQKNILDDCELCDDIDKAIAKRDSAKTQQIALFKANKNMGNKSNITRKTYGTYSYATAEKLKVSKLKFKRSSLSKHSVYSKGKFKRKSLKMSYCHANFMRNRK